MTHNIYEMRETLECILTKHKYDFLQQLNISRTAGGWQISDGPNKIRPVSAWELDRHIRSMWSSTPPARLGANGDSGRVFMWCNAVRWVSSLLIPPLFPTHNKARPRPGPVQRPGLSDLWHNANLCPPRREGASLRCCRRLLLWEGLVFSHRDDNWDGREGIWAVI